MKILFSVFNEDHESGAVQIIESLWVQTDWSAQQIDNHIALYDGFRSEIEIGENLSFFDYYCYFDISDELLRRIKTIQYSAHEPIQQRMPFIFRVDEFDPGNADAPTYPSGKQLFLYELERYECGASGFEAIVYWASTHPLEMVFIGGFLYDCAKYILAKPLKWLGISKVSDASRPVVLNTRKIYHNFAKATNIKVEDCQITKFNRLRVGVFHVKIRTSTNRKFKLKCYANGTIASLEEITNTHE